MKNNIILLSALVGLLFFVSCNDDDDMVTTVDFGTPPAAALVTSGTVEVVTEDEVRYHTLVFGELVTSVIVESETGVAIVDVAFAMIPNSGAELRAYADAINKPISVIITHAHQDHYGNIGSFNDLAVYAETKSAAVLATDPVFTGLYTGAINAVSGSQTVGGTNFMFESISNTEATENGYLTIPDHASLFPGDLVFNRSHAYIREYTPLDSNDELTTWINGLNDMKVNYGDYRHIFMGHNGRRVDVGITLDENIAYLTDAQGLIKGTKELTAGGFATSVVEVTTELALLYPDYAPGGLRLANPDGFFPGDPGANWFN